MTQPYFPSILSKWKKGFRLKKVSALDTPPADYLAVYYDSADSKLKTKNESGTVKILSDALVSPIAESDVTNLVSDLASKYSATNRQTVIVNSEISTVDASKITTGTMATARLGSGVADATTFLRGDQTYVVPTVGSSMTAQGGQLTADQSLVSTTLIDLTNLTVTLPNTGKKATIVFTIQISDATGVTPYIIIELLDNGVSKAGIFRDTGAYNDSISVTYMAICSGQIVKLQGRVNTGSINIGGAQTYRRSSWSSMEGAN